MRCPARQPALRHLREGKTAHRSPSSGVAHPIEHTVPPDDRGDLLDHKHEQQRAASAQDDVMKLEEELELERLLIGHDCLEREDDDEVGDESSDDRVCRGQRGLALLILNEISRDLRKGDVGEQEVGEGGHGGRKESLRRTTVKSVCLKSRAQKQVRPK